jgi:hypothetical protein
MSGDKASSAPADIDLTNADRRAIILRSISAEVGETPTEQRLCEFLQQRGNDANANVVRAELLSRWLGGAPNVDGQTSCKVDRPVRADRTLAHAKAVAFVDGQIALGKPIHPLREHYITRHLAEPTMVEKEIANLPCLVLQHGGSAQSDLPPDPKGNLNIAPKGETHAHLLC